ncbi:hypothetical protein SAMN06265174_11067 [Dietzia kunjamensis subsp. schimae]|uniref:Uncharacterized protein n=1 Tax=Dietzia kunjamensis subsp. schimae TaxID=498198 RepID=A0ABY1N4S1_9ACTN|nr:hypothetical protein SAMN06265174_11067 [Dietzia kunjamensis subsp. schimae]
MKSCADSGRRFAPAELNDGIRGERQFGGVSGTTTQVPWMWIAATSVTRSSIKFGGASSLLRAALYMNGAQTTRTVTTTMPAIALRSVRVRLRSKSAADRWVRVGRQSEVVMCRNSSQT